MATRVNPTRMELSRQKKRLKTAVKGHKLLKDKRDEMVRQFMLCIRRNRELRKEVEAALSADMRRVAIAAARMGSEDIGEALLSEAGAGVTLEVGSRNIMGVSVPTFTGEGGGEISELPYSFAFTSAELDGAGQFYIFRKMVLPMSTPILATIGLITAVSYWNDWTNGLYYVTDAKLFSIQQLLNEMNNNIAFLANNAKDLGGIDLGAIPSATIRLAIAVVAILPVLIAYPFFQKFFAKGIAIGAVKG